MSIAGLDLQRPRVVLVGYSGRDREAVAAHVAELEREGVPAPVEVPAVWEVEPDLLTQDDMIAAPELGTSGEAEPVLILTGGGAYVAVGSDHTDRRLERTSMDGAKQACAKVVSRDCWALADVRDRWDAITLHAEIEVDGEWRAYQSATLSALLPPDWYIERFGGGADTVVFCGTVPVLGGLETRATGFRAELRDPAGPVLTCTYSIGAVVR